MPHPLSLHHLVAPDVSAARLVRIAASLGCAHVCLFTQDPQADMAFPTVAPQEMRELRATLAGEGVTAWGLAAFALTPELDPLAYHPALERAAMLGGARANMRVLDPDEARATDNFGAFATLCAGHGIIAGIEFTGFGLTDALPQAERIVRGAGQGGIALDALHVARTGTTDEQLSRLDPGLVSYVQLCDGPLEGSAEDYGREGAFDRLPPGEGAFPLRALIDKVPRDFPLSLEVPCERWRAQGMDPQERARRVVDATRGLLASVAA